jgi:hypothetical protein
MDDLAAADLSIRRLLRRLCTSIARDHFVGDPQPVSRLPVRLEDTAHSVLLGLHPVSSRWLPRASRLPLRHSGKAHTQRRSVPRRPACRRRRRPMCRRQTVRSWRRRAWPLQPRSCSKPATPAWPMTSMLL